VSFTLSILLLNARLALPALPTSGTDTVRPFVHFVLQHREGSCVKLYVVPICHMLRLAASVAASRAFAALASNVDSRQAGQLANQARPARSLFQKALKALSGTEEKKEKGDRQLFNVKWYDEYATLGDDPAETHKAMVEEDQRLRSSALFTSPLRKTVFDEIVQHRKRFSLVRI
jgi:hypothetical protein